jgi:N-acetylneuraminic acid mutarotase
MNMQSIFRVLVVAFLGMSSLSLVAEGNWTRKADMPTERFGLCACVVDGKVYAIGGGRDLFGAYLPTVEVYDPTTDAWTERANLPTARCFLSACVANGRIYAIGGSPSAQTGSSIVEEYDPATDTWTRKANMPTSRTFLSTCVVGETIYAIGGRMYPGGIVSTVEAYHPQTDTWTRKADMPTARASLSACVVNGMIYAIGGKGPDADVAIVEEYDPSTNTWTRKADMPKATRAPSASVLGGRVYAIGGGVPETVFATVAEYDPAIDAWTLKLDMPTARFLHSSVEVDGNIYAIGGSVEWWPQIPTSMVEEYTPSLIVDFNGDGRIDGKDVLILAGHWGMDDSMCDLAPPPFGDGTVDLQDLVALADYIGKEVNDPTLIAHWALDEAEGAVAHDSAGDNHGTVVDFPLWRSDGGKVGGALEFDGMTSIVVDFVLNPPSGPFSALAWVRNGAPGQTILSQADGRDWLSIDPATGALGTELTVGLILKPLVSQAVVTDGDWHRAGVSWDGAHLVLCVDDVEVARKAQSSMASSPSGLYIGAGRKLNEDAFFTGLIDDVRIYNRAVRP